MIIPQGKLGFISTLPNTKIFNKDITNKKERPFIVDKGEYPFKSNWYEKDGVSMHYIDEGEGIIDWYKKMFV